MVDSVRTSWCHTDSGLGTNSGRQISRRATTHQTAMATTMLAPTTAVWRSAPEPPERDGAAVRCGVEGIEVEAIAYERT